MPIFRYNCFFGFRSLFSYHPGRVYEYETDSTNLLADPLFQLIDPDNPDSIRKAEPPFYAHLNENSPCIDVGDPDSPDDPDGTRADMGAFYFHQNLAAVERNFHLTGGYKLFAAYPNPFNSRTTIRYSQQFRSLVSLELFDISGRRISILEQGMRDAGEHRSILNAGNIPAGTYFVRLSAGNENLQQQILLLK